MVGHPEESEEQAIDRLLQELGIWLPKVDLEGNDPLEATFDAEVAETPLPETFSERRLAPFV